MKTLILKTAQDGKKSNSSSQQNLWQDQRSTKITEDKEVWRTIGNKEDRGCIQDTVQGKTLIKMKFVYKSRESISDDFAYNLNRINFLSVSKEYSQGLCIHLWKLSEDLLRNSVRSIDIWLRDRSNIEAKSYRVEFPCSLSHYHHILELIGFLFFNLESWSQIKPSQLWAFEDLSNVWGCLLHRLW